MCNLGASRKLDLHESAAQSLRFSLRATKGMPKRGRKLQKSS
jgi:hypothetical protein